MKEILDPILLFLQSLMEGSNPVISISVGMLVIVLESIIPMLPLALFIAFNVIVFGNFFGFLLSWIATILGCSLAFFLVRKGIHLSFSNHSKRRQQIFILIEQMNQISFSSLVLLLAFPFTPAFLINIGAGISRISYRKFLLALIISKAVIVYFWGFIGTSMLESVHHPLVVIKIGILLVGSFLLSKLAIKQFQLESR